MTLKKAWITPWPTCDSLFTLSLESASIEEPKRLSIEQSVFPVGQPSHHVTLLRLLDADDLLILRDVITAYLEEIL